jgi:hypothetical protein
MVSSPNARINASYVRIAPFKKDLLYVNTPPLLVIGFLSFIGGDFPVTVHAEPQMVPAPVHGVMLVKLRLTGRSTAPGKK